MVSNYKKYFSSEKILKTMYRFPPLQNYAQLCISSAHQVKYIEVYGSNIKCYENLVSKYFFKVLYTEWYSHCCFISYLWVLINPYLYLNSYCKLKNIHTQLEPAVWLFFLKYESHCLHVCIMNHTDKGLRIISSFSKIKNKIHASLAPWSLSLLVLSLNKCVWLS